MSEKMSIVMTSMTGMHTHNRLRVAIGVAKGFCLSRLRTHPRSHPARGDTPLALPFLPSGHAFSALPDSSPHQRPCTHSEPPANPTISALCDTVPRLRTPCTICRAHTR